MSTLLSYVPLVLDVLVILFFVLCLKAGYDDKLSGAIKTAGAFGSMVLSGLLVRLVWPLISRLVNLAKIPFDGFELEADVVELLAMCMVIVIFFVIFFVIIMALWKKLRTKTSKLTKKVSGQPIDKILGLVLFGILGLIIIITLAWVFYDLTALISEEQMGNTILLSFLTNIF